MLVLSFVLRSANRRFGLKLLLPARVKAMTAFLNCRWELQWRSRFQQKRFCCAIPAQSKKNENGTSLRLKVAFYVTRTASFWQSTLVGFDMRRTETRCHFSYRHCFRLAL